MKTHPFWAIPLFILAVGAPLSVAAGSIGTALCALVALVAFARGHRWEVPRLMGIPLFAMVVAYLLATALNETPHWNKFVDELWIRSLLLSVPLLLTAAGFSRARPVALAFLASGGAVAAYGVVQHFTGIDLVREGNTGTQGERFMAYGFYGHHLSYGGHVLVLWCLAAAWLAEALEVGRARRLAPWLAALLSSLGLLFSYARSAQVGAVAALGSLTLTGGSKLRGLALVVAVLGLGAVLLTPSLRMRFVELANPANEETRLNLWKSSWAGIQDRPVLGWGPGNFHLLLDKHEVDGFYDTRAHSHNDYLMYAVNAGALGLLSAMAFLGGLILLLARRAPRDLLARAALAALVALMVGGLFQFYQSDDEVEFSLYLMVGLALAGWNRKG